MDDPRVVTKIVKVIKTNEHNKGKIKMWTKK